MNFFHDLIQYKMWWQSENFHQGENYGKYKANRTTPDNHQLPTKEKRIKNQAQPHNS